MKIKNILHNATLRLWLLAAALIPAISASAVTHIPYTPTGSSVKESLNALTGTITISNTDEFLKTDGTDGKELVTNTYYKDGNGNTWYNKFSRGNISSYLDWKIAHGIAFKLNPGTYNITVEFQGKAEAALWIYSGDNHIGTYDSTKGETFEGVTSNYNTYTRTITVTNESCWWISNNSDKGIRIHSIKVEPATPLSTQFPSGNGAITDNTFWYHNGGGGFGYNGEVNAAPFYRYFNYKAGTLYAPTDDKKNVIINGDGSFKSYELRSGDAIGFRLSKNSQYRIKIYYHKVDASAPADLYVGENLNSGSRLGNWVKTTIKNDYGEDTDTRLRTYDISTGDNDVYWIKNDGDEINKPLYLGGFEILPYINVNPSAEAFTGTWNVADEAGDLANSNDNDKVIGEVAKAHGNVGLDGPSMAINKYLVGGNRSVMLNKDNTISVNIPANATITFTYTADAAADGVTIAGYDFANGDATNYNTFSGHEGKVSYTNPGAAQTIHIKGMSANYAYLSGFQVTDPNQPEVKDPMDEAKPISQDYVWYPVAHELFGDGVFSDENKTVFIYKDFSPQSNTTRIQLNTDNRETYHLRGKSMIAYRVNKNGTQIGFKIAANKKGVINCYYPVSSNQAYFPLYQSDDAASLGKALERITGTMDQTGSTDRGITYAQYYFDTTGGEKTFWLKADTENSWFGGFEVLFDEGNNGGQPLAKDVEYAITATETIKNALSDDTYSAIKSTTTAPVAGPSMILCPDLAANTVMTYKRGDHRNGIMLKIPSDCKALRVKGYLNDASLRIYRGTASAPDASAYVEISGSKVVDNTVLLSSLEGVSGDVYWISTNKEAGAYLTSVTPIESLTDLQPTNVNYIYKVDSALKNGVLVSGDTNGRILFVDGDNSSWINTGAGMNVLGTKVSPVTMTNGSDLFGVKVGTGPNGVKTGYVKVYFNGGNADKHKMEELPLDQQLYSGWNSSYDPATQTITFPGEGGGRGWWFGNEGEGARDLSAYNKINIELGAITGSPTLQLVVQSTNGASARFQADSQGRLLGDLNDQTKWYTNNETGATFDITKIAQIYIQDNNVDATSATVKIKSARLMNKPIVIATDNDQDSSNGYTEVFGGKIYDLPDGKLYEYPFDLNNAATDPQMIWITGAGTNPNTLNIAAIEVIYDSNHAKVVEWYVNKDTKMIVGSDDPNFKINFQGKTLEYPEGYDEYVTFYMSSGRQASVSFIMPEAVREIQDWYDVVKGLDASKIKDGDYVSEAKDESIAKTYGKHVIHIDGGDDVDKYGIDLKNDKISFQATTNTIYDRDNGISPTRNKIGNTLYAWYSYAYTLPSNIFNNDYTNKDFAAGVSIKATQKENGSDNTETVGGKKGEWKIYMRFISFKAPEASNSSNKVSVAEGQTGKTIYYTVDSSEPENLGDASIINDHSTTETYSSSTGVNVSGMNCIFKAAQYINTDFYFYDDISKGKDSAIGNVFKVVSRDLAIANENPSVVYVKNKTLTDDELFNEQDGGYMLTIPTGDVMTGVTPHEQKYNANPFMYLTLGGKDWPRLNGNSFELCGTNWKASDDSGLKTYLDSYQYKFDVDGVANPEWWKDKDNKTISGNQNQNPYTECNAGVGGSDTEDGGMFLQPIGGASLRFEPEYDGVITVWLRQNGCLDNNTQETGGFSRRPVYVMDENGRIMRRSTVRPTASHYMGINGTWAINSSVCEQRSQVEHTWLSEVAKKVFEDHPLYAGRFGADYVDRWSTSGNDHSGHILYGWWYKGFDLDATRSTLNSAAHVSRFEYMEPELLYRSDGIFNMEMNRLGLENKFAKYGYELPNFQYVRYRIPVKAGKTYYIAGRGTKNGFSAIRFDALKPNTNLSTTAMEDLRYSDNPQVVENQTQGTDYLKVTNNWDNNGNRYYKSTEMSTYDLTGKSESEVQDAYSGLYELKISDTGESNAAKIDVHVKAGESGKNYDTNGNLVGKTVDFQLTRTFRAGNWHPIILPFSLSETRVEQYFGEGTVVLYLDPYAHTQSNQVDEATGKKWISALNPALEGTKLSFTYHRYHMLYANTPAFICPTFEWSDNNKKSPATNKVKPDVSNGAVSSITFKRVTLDGSNSQNDLGNGYFGYAISNDYEVVGSYNKTTQTGDIYYINNTNPEGGFASNTAELVHSENKTVNMKGFRVWIRPKAGRNPAPIKTVGSRGFSDFEEDSEMTGISDIVADDYTIEGYDIEDDSVYDLLGRKMGQGSLDGLQKGVYIFHGRKVYVK